MRKPQLLYYESVNGLCESTSVEADCIANALNALVEPIEAAELYGLAFILEMLAERTKQLRDHIADTPLTSEGVSYE